MEKRGFLFTLFVLFFLNLFIIVCADENNDSIQITSSRGQENNQINRAYACLDSKVDGKCSSLSLNEKIFSALAVGKCTTELNRDARNSECWPSSSCNIKTTAQVILALNGKEKAENWIKSKSKVYSGLIWYLQIESIEKTDCQITYSGSTYDISIGDDKKISSFAGPGLSLASGSYWLKIQPEYYSKEFQISCDKSFKTSLLFKKKGSSMIYVPSTLHSGSAEATITETVNSFCFSDTSSCDYESNLWAVLALKTVDEDFNFTDYLPYLITSLDENEKYMPESFIYALTGQEEYRNKLLLKQKSNSYWLESGDKFYDTALALYPFRFEEGILQKENSKDWLLSEGVQDNEGCWQGNILNTAFLLYSLWPKESVPSVEENCEEKNYYCMYFDECISSGGDELDYDCPNIMHICCDTEKISETCADKGGTICTSEQTICEGGNFDANVKGLLSGEQCCVGGVCKKSTPSTSECEDSGGTCRYACKEDEEIDYSYECGGNYFCCFTKTSGQNYTLIIILIVLILLVIIGILFRNKLRRLWVRIKSKFGKSKPGFRKRPMPPEGPFFAQPSSRLPLRRPPRRLPLRRPPRRLPLRRPPLKRPKRDLDAVLKKLKEMSK